MTAVLTAPAATDSARPGRPTSLARTYRFELVKLISQWRVRVLLAVCWIGPAVFVGVVSRQSFLPSDTVFGRWMNSSGWAGALVVLAFAGTWALPLLTSLVAGDVFAVEDRLGTWRHLLVAVRSPRTIFAAKVLACGTVVGALVMGLACSAAVGGLISVGGRPLVGLDGTVFPGGLLESSGAGGRFVLAWLTVLAPTLAFSAVGVLGSVVLGRSPVGLFVPALLAVGLALVQLLPLPVPVRLALPSQGFVAWRGLFTDPIQPGPLVAGLVAGLAWTIVALVAARHAFLARDFTDLANDGSGRRFLLGGVLPLGVLTVASVLVLAVATPASGSGIDRGKLETSLATAYGHLYVLQSQELRRPAVTEAQMQTTAECDKGGSLVVDAGPGTDWRCVVSWHLPGATAVGSAIYQLDVTADGRYVADGDGPVDVNGFFQVQAPYGTAPNPLWQFDGSVDLLAPAREE